MEIRKDIVNELFRIQFQDTTLNAIVTEIYNRLNNSSTCVFTILCKLIRRGGRVTKLSIHNFIDYLSKLHSVSFLRIRSRPYMHNLLSRFRRDDN